MNDACIDVYNTHSGKRCLIVFRVWPFRTMDICCTCQFIGLCLRVSMMYCVGNVHNIVRLLFIQSGPDWQKLLDGLPWNLYKHSWVQNDEYCWLWWCPDISSRYHEVYSFVFFGKCQNNNRIDCYEICTKFTNFNLYTDMVLRGWVLMTLLNWLFI